MTYIMETYTAQQSEIIFFTMLWRELLVLGEWGWGVSLRSRIIFSNV